MKNKGSGIRTGKSAHILSSMKVGKPTEESNVPLNPRSGLMTEVRAKLEACEDGKFIPFTFESKEHLLYVQSAVMMGMRNKGFRIETRSDMSTFTLYVRILKDA